MGLSGEEGVGTGPQPSPSKCVKKVLISRQTLHGALQHIGFDPEF